MKLINETVSKSTMHVTRTYRLSTIDDSGSFILLIVEMLSGCSLRDTELRIDSLFANVALLAGVNVAPFYRLYEPSFIDLLIFYLHDFWFSNLMCSRFFIFSIIFQLGLYKLPHSLSI